MVGLCVDASPASRLTRQRADGFHACTSAARAIVDNSFGGYVYLDAHVEIVGG